VSINDEQRKRERKIEQAIRDRNAGLETPDVVFMNRLPDAADKRQAFLQAKREAAQRKQANHG